MSSPPYPLTMKVQRKTEQSNFPMHCPPPLTSPWSPMCMTNMPFTSHPHPYPQAFMSIWPSPYLIKRSSTTQPLATWRNTDVPILKPACSQAKHERNNSRVPLNPSRSLLNPRANEFSLPTITRQSVATQTEEERVESYGLIFHDLVEKSFRSIDSIHKFSDIK
jgi:hypothetical protein